MSASQSRAPLSKRMAAASPHDPIRMTARYCRSIAFVVRQAG
jgi:hypothetical protein